MKHLYHIDHFSARRSFGNKARGLKKLRRHGFPVPTSWCIPAETRDLLLKDPDIISNQLLTELEQLGDTVHGYAVRSSGEMEDHPDFSFAGQFVTELNVHGVQSLMGAVRNVWDSAEEVAKGSYTRRIDKQDKDHRMAVIVQEMILARWSGVAFSINPVTGRTETVIEGLPGGGEKVVQEGLNPQRWVHHQGTWEPFDESVDLPESILQSIVKDLQILRRVFGGEVDVEWSWDGSKLWYLQCRAVTSRKFPTIYSNHISREVLPGMIKPLVWSVNIPIVNSAWLRLLSGILGKLDIKPEALSRAFYYRAYFNMGTLGTLFRMMGLPRDSLESLMGRKDPSGKSSFRPSLKTMRYLPSMFWFLFSNLTLARKFKRKILELNFETDQLQDQLSSMQFEDYQDNFQRLHALVSESAYWNIIIPLTMQITNHILNRKMEKRGQDFNLLEFAGDFPELLEHDPQIHLEELRREWFRLPEEERREITSLVDLEKLELNPTLKAIQTGLEKIISRFGHFSESGNDFSYEPWRENPAFVFDMVRDTSAKDPEQVKASMATKKKMAAPKRAYRRAGHFRLYREMISSSYTRSYGLFRILFLTTGKYFTEKGYLKEPGHVFYLTLEEHDRLLKGLDPAEISGIREKINRVKEEMESYREISLPSVIYGEKPPPIAVSEENMLKGIPTSPGIFTGTVVVVKGYKDFQKSVEGKILVIPFSDVGWTPLLSRAGAIVSESGGILSHASILARELNIPAISSVDFACNIKDGKKATVDGNNGYLLLTKHANGNDI